MGNNFDIAAEDYDEIFTNSAIGILQRRQVHDYLNRHLSKDTKIRILEINCGTGEDARWFAKQGHKVLATDASPRMIEVAKSKVNFSNIEFQQMRIQDLHLLDSKEPFDLIFSNFGGLNCLDPKAFSPFLKDAKKRLAPNGAIIMVIMPKNCIWDNKYHLLKGNWSYIGRRNTSEKVLVNVHNEKIETWYYNPKDILKLSTNKWQTVKYFPIGFFVPPSFMETFFKNKKVILKGLGWLDTCVSKVSFLARFSDHYIIHLKA